MLSSGPLAVVAHPFQALGRLLVSRELPFRQRVGRGVGVDRSSSPAGKQKRVVSSGACGSSSVWSSTNNPVAEVDIALYACAPKRDSGIELLEVPFHALGRTDCGSAVERTKRWAASAESRATDGVAFK